MGVLSRIGIALDSDLLKRFDRLIGQRGYTNRSEAFRDLIRDQLVTERPQPRKLLLWALLRSSTTITPTASLKS